MMQWLEFSKAPYSTSQTKNCFLTQVTDKKSNFFWIPSLTAFYITWAKLNSTWWQKSWIAATTWYSVTSVKVPSKLRVIPKHVAVWLVILRCFYYSITFEQQLSQCLNTEEVFPNYYFFFLLCKFVPLLSQPHAENPKQQSFWESSSFLVLSRCCLGTS